MCDAKQQEIDALRRRVAQLLEDRGALRAAVTAALRYGFSDTAEGRAMRFKLEWALQVTTGGSDAEDG